MQLYSTTPADWAKTYKKKQIECNKKDSGIPFQPEKYFLQLLYHLYIRVILPWLNDGLVLGKKKKIHNNLE